jgi:hypothetical protein
VPIHPAFVAFRAVFVPAGNHRVVFRYEPAGFRAGLVVTAIGALCAVVLLIWPKSLMTLSPAHAHSPWPWHWPLWAVVLAVAILVPSTIPFSPSHAASIHRRWSIAFHKFTWDAGVTAMQQETEWTGKRRPDARQEFDRVRRVK